MSSLLLLRPFALCLFFLFFFFFNDTATTEIYTLSLHDALPTSLGAAVGLSLRHRAGVSSHDIEHQLGATMGVARTDIAVLSDDLSFDRSCICRARRSRGKAARSSARHNHCWRG